MIAPVVDAAWTAAHREQLVLADVRWYLDRRPGRAEYDRGHIPGAVYVELEQWLAAPASVQGGRHPLPDPERFARGMGELGIGDADTVVAYDDQGGVMAARLVWMLRATGREAALLDGGLAAWEDRSRPSRPAARRRRSARARGRRRRSRAPTTPPTPPTPSSTPVSASATSERARTRSIRVPVTSPARAASRPASTSARTAACSRGRSSAAASGQRAWTAPSRSSPTAGRASRPATTSSCSSTPGSAPGACIPARGRSGAATLSRPAETGERA